MSIPPIPPPSRGNPPPPIAYRSNDLPDPGPKKNTPLKFLGRMCLDIGLGVVGCIAGVYLANVTGVQWLGFFPPGAALATAIVIAVKFRRHGYVTGVIIAPFLIAVSLIVLLLIVCGGMLSHPGTT